MENYILNLLKENNRVIIPEFGAFIIRQKDPPEIAFNGLLTFNDGILTEYISSKTGITFLEAAAKVTDYVDTLKSHLKIHNRLIFNEIGWVWTDDSGDKQFTPWHPSGNIQTEKQTGKKDIESILKEAEKIVTDQSENIADTVILPPSDSAPFILDETSEIYAGKSPDESVMKEDFSPESFSLDDEEKSPPSHLFTDGEPEIIAETPREKDKSEPIVRTIEPSMEHETSHDHQGITPEIPTIDEPVAGKSMTPEPSPQKKSLEELWQETAVPSSPQPVKTVRKQQRSWLTALMVIVVIGSLGCTAWFVFPDQIKSILHLNPKVNEEMIQEETFDQSILTSPGEEPAEAPAIQEISADPGTEETVLTPEPEVPVNVQTEVKKFYIVAGMFSSRKNAEILVAELKGKGFNAELFGTRDKLYAVSFGSFSTRGEAERERDRIRQTTEPKAWILEY